LRRWLGGGRRSARTLAVRRDVEALDVGLQLDGLDAILPAATDLDRPKLLVTDQRPDLRDRGRKDVGDIGEGEKPWFPLGGGHVDHYASV